MGLDLKALAEVTKDLEQRSSSGSKYWIQASKIEKVIDIRIQDPLPAMNGIYFAEVPIWWINNTKIISPKLFGVQEPDVVKDIIEEAKRAKDKDVLALLNAKTEKGFGKIQYKTEFWVPVLKFNWETGSRGELKGIYNDKNEPDTNLILKYIEDGKWKILVVPITALKAINVIATSRQGHLLTDPIKGFNTALSKTGEGKQTKYFANTTDILPMPQELYEEGVRIDPFELAQSYMYTKEYMEAVIGKYLYNDVEIPEDSEDNYAFPDLRAKYKAMFAEDAVPQEETKARPRPGGRAPELTPAPEVKTPETPAARSRRAPETPAPARGGRPGRNLADDLKAVE